MLNHKVFVQLHRNLCKNGSFITKSYWTLTKIVRDPSMDETILNTEVETPSTSTRIIARPVHVS